MLSSRRDFFFRLLTHGCFSKNDRVWHTYNLITIWEHVLLLGRNSNFFSPCATLSLARVWNRERNECYINTCDERKITIYIRDIRDYAYEMSSPSFILPDSPPPQHVLNYWQRKAAESCASSSAAAASAPASTAPHRSTSPGGEMVIGDSPIQRLRPPATWAPRRAVLTTLSNNIRERQAKRKLDFEEGEVSGEEDSVLPQSKKRMPDEDSSLVPLIKEAEMGFVELINKPVAKPWVPLRELEEDQPYRIVCAREHTNQHGRRIILKIINAGSKCEVYLPQRFASCIDAAKIREFNVSCKNYVLVVTHKCPNWTDIKIVKA
ncbi:uncharacterized protein LOC120352698 [Nilaparvata lugens]|uniref:uncharacterized protein LOC120352698 n=1 Tax=Nilaparvata lugens TaxID=108931 RepID=UPI00193EBC65|nr:uncharacterized protein LOC120352698 [Nilaparvata lugens]